MLSLILFLLALSASIHAQETPKKPTILTFEQFQTKFNLAFPASDLERRKQIYQINVTKLLQNPCEWCGVTQFFASTWDQINQNRHLYLPLNIDELQKQQQTQKQQEGFLVSAANEIKYRVGAPSSLDWRENNAVTTAKHQGTCGTCWSFATVAMCQSSLILQGRAFNSAFYAIDLSEQFLLKCTSGSSCSGGYLQTALDKALSYGLPYQTDFPYSPYSPYNYGLCTTDDVVHISDLGRQSFYNAADSKIIQMLQDGPITAAISADGWQSYSSGVFRCSSGASVNHAALIVGYTSEYWILKNSWGPQFGENGFIRITRDRAMNCKIGIAVHQMSQFHLELRTLWIMLIVLTLMAMG